jgi:uncharacterized protein YbbC (DUF1343 family)
MRGMQWPETKRTFVPPSPNIRNPEAALLYVGIGMFEATNVSVGRGTDSPFAHIGAPWMNGAVLAARLNSMSLPGVRVSSATFTPTSDIYAGKLCSGIHFEIVEPQLLRPIDLFVQIVWLLREFNRRDFQVRWDEMIRLTGSRDFENAYKANKPAEDVLKAMHDSAQAFETERKPFLLY